MRKRFLTIVTLLVMVITFVWLTPTPTSGQAPATASASDQGWTPTLLPDGQPDIQGIYINPWPFTIENYTAEEREEFQQAMLEHRGPQTGAYDSDWLEQSITERRPDYPYPDDYVGVVDPRTDESPGRIGRSSRRSTSRIIPTKSVSSLTRVSDVSPRAHRAASSGATTTGGRFCSRQDMS